MKEIILVILVAALACLITSFGNQTDFEKTKRMQEHVESLPIQEALNKHKIPTAEENNLICDVDSNVPVP